MSDSHTAPYQPTPGTTQPKRRAGLVTGLLVLLFASVVLAAAIWYAGGTDSLARIGELVAGSFASSPFGQSSGSPTPPAPAASVVASSSASGLPEEAQQRMFTEQVESRDSLKQLVEGNVVELSTGEARRSEDSATVPITVTFKGGARVSATVGLRRYGEKWYFFSLERGGNGSHSSPGVKSDTFDSGVVSTITEQQALPGTQEMMTAGLLGGGYHTVKVERVTMGPRTATIDVVMSGGSEPPSKGRFVCVSKTEAGITYWFVARFEKR